MEAPPESRHEAGAAAIAALTNWRRSIAEDIAIPLVSVIRYVPQTGPTRCRLGSGVEAGPQRCATALKVSKSYGFSCI